MDRIPLRMTNRKNQSPITIRHKKSCAEGAGGKDKLHDQPNQSQNIEAASKVNQTRHNHRQAGQFLMLLFSIVLFINILLIGEKVLKNTPGWKTIGLAVILGWLSSMSVNLEENSAKQAVTTTLTMSLIALLIGTAIMLREAKKIEEPLLLVLVVATGTTATVVKNYLDVASVTRKE
ncbi:MAG: hypothetical protein WHV66_00040 [Anaerolineales bacterium]